MNFSKLSLPAAVTVRRSGDTYVIRNGTAEIGGVVVSGTPFGHTELKPYVKDATSERNIQIVALVAQQMSDALLEHIAGKPEHLRRSVFRPDNAPPGTVYETQVFPCTRCRQIIAKLVFSWDSASAHELEAVSKKFEVEASVAKYPVWIIGGPDSDGKQAKHLTLQMAPTKGHVVWEHPEVMNLRLVALDKAHC